MKGERGREGMKRRRKGKKKEGSSFWLKLKRVGVVCSER